MKGLGWNGRIVFDRVEFKNSYQSTTKVLSLPERDFLMSYKQVLVHFCFPNKDHRFYLLTNKNGPNRGPVQKH